MNAFAKVANQFKLCSDRVFAIDPINNKQYTYADFYECALKSASFLRAQGFQRGDRVGLKMINSVEFASFYFGCLFAGVTAVPIYPKLHANDITYIKEHSKLKGVLDENSLMSLKSQQILQEDWLQTASEDAEFCITFTSGTTSKPKGVVHKLSSLINSAEAFNQRMEFDQKSRFLHVMPMTYMAGILNTLLCPFMAGGSVLFEDAFGPMSALRFWGHVMKYEVNTFWLAPTMLAALMRGDRNPLGVDYCKKNVRTICVGTAPLSPKLKTDFEQHYQTRLYESYGLSELLFVSTNCPKFNEKRASVGKLLPDVNVKIMNDDEELSDGSEGEIYIRTPNRMLGYLDDNFNANLETSPEWFPSGDIGTLSAEGYLSITSRKKDLIIKGGLNISPRAVEEVLGAHPSIEEVAVVGLPHEFLGEAIYAALKLEDDSTLSDIRDSLIKHCEKYLSEASRPNQYVVMKTLPKNSNGKIQKNKIVDHILGSAQSR